MLLDGRTYRALVTSIGMSSGKVPIYYKQGAGVSWEKMRISFPIWGPPAPAAMAAVSVLTDLH